MIIEDDKDIRDLLTELLEMDGHTVHAYRNGQEAIDALLGGAVPEIIFVDWRMPIMGGEEFLRQFRAIKSERQPPPVYVVSAESDARTFGHLDCAGVLSKPLNTKSLRSLLTKFEESHRI